MTPETGLALAIIGLALILFIAEWLTIDTVAILVTVAFMATGMLTPKEGFQGFTNPATLTVRAMFIISYAVFHSGALSQVGALLNQASGAGCFLLLLAVMATTSILSGMVNNTAVIALLIPVLLNLSREEGRFASRFNPIKTPIRQEKAAPLIGLNHWQACVDDRGIPCRDSRLFLKRAAKNARQGDSRWKH